jgi:hypothetical protein
MANSGNAITTRYRKGLPEVLTLPWMLGTSSDLDYPQAVGRRPFGLRALNWYFGRLLEITSQNTRICRQFFEVLHLRKGVGTLLALGVSVPVLLYGLQSLFVPLARRANVEDLPAAPQAAPG